MGQVIGGVYVPGPNDHHIDGNGQIAPGLGKDEPSVKKQQLGRAAGEARMAELRREIDEMAKEQDLKANDLEQRENALEAKEIRLRAKLIAAGIDPDADEE